MASAIAGSLILRLSFLAALFLIVVIGVTMALNAITERRALRHRLLQPNDVGEESTGEGHALLRRQARDEGWLRFTDAIEKAGIPLADEKNSGLRTDLAMIGLNSSAAPAIFTLVRLALLLAVPSAYLLFAFSRAQPPSPLTLYIVCSLLAALGVYLPNLWLKLKAGERRQVIVNGFPDCLDLMLVCVEAGLSMEAAFDRVGREIVHSHPRLAEIISMTTLELRAGASRDQALRGLANRAQVEEIRAFATLLIQSDKLGTSIGATLRVYAAEMRQRRRLKAEEKAHRLPVLLSIPLVMCMLPAMVGVLMLPASLKIARTLVPLMTAGSQ